MNAIPGFAYSMDTVDDLYGLDNNKEHMNQIFVEKNNQLDIPAVLFDWRDFHRATFPLSGKTKGRFE